MNILEDKHVVMTLDAGGQISFFQLSRVEKKLLRGLVYDPLRRLCIGVSKIGTSKAIALGAYNFALRKMGEL